MGKHYGALIMESVMQFKKEGYIHREIGEKYGYSRDQIKDLVKQYNRKQKKLQSGLLPKAKGRPKKGNIKRDTFAEQKYEIKRLKMENELLRDFLYLVGTK